MTIDAQLYLAIGLPTLAVLVGILTNTLLFQSLSARLNQMENRIQGLDTKKV